jgi:uncharacterized protein involved in exopolysaccharide biosynthesis
MQYQTSDKSHQEGEIDLVELWRIIVKRRYLIIGIFIITIISAIIYLFISKPFYQSQAIVEIGTVGYNPQEIFIEDPEILIETLPNQYGNPSVMLKAKNILTLSVLGSSPKLAQNSMQRTVNELINKHQVLYDQVIQLRQNRLNGLKTQYQVLSSNSSSVLQRAELADQIAQTELLLTKVYARPTQVLKKPTFEPNPVKPKKKLYLLIAIVLGLMFSFIGVFIAEFITKFKAEISESK